VQTRRGASKRKTEAFRMTRLFHCVLVHRPSVRDSQSIPEAARFLGVSQPVDDSQLTDPRAIAADEGGWLAR
jgi:hypothetical protein